MSEIIKDTKYKNFDAALKESKLYPLTATNIEILQINFGLLCNQSCKHCHVEAGPNRTEIITKETLEYCLGILRNSEIPTVDITGGAPEMNANFKWFINEVKNLQRHILVRCNLTILLETGFEDLPQFYADNKVEIVASLPYFLERNVDSQRGKGTFDKSIKALQILNNLGYGEEDSPLKLDLV